METLTLCFILCVCVCVCVCTRGKVMQGRQHDWWHWGVIVIKSITPQSALCKGDTRTQARTHMHTHTHTHTDSHTFTGSPMGHSDTVQIKQGTDGYVDVWKEREKGRERGCVCVCVIVWYIFIFV